MHTIIEKISPNKKVGQKIVNKDGMVWEARLPEGVDKETINNAKYRAIIPDERIDHFSFECFGYHQAWADTIEELIEDIKSFKVPYYSEDELLNKIRKADFDNNVDDRRVTLWCDSRGTKVFRGEYNLNNMTAYTSF